MAMNDDEAAALYDEDHHDADPSESDNKEQASYESFLAPKSAWGSKPIEIGEEYMFKVVSIQESEVVLQYSTGKSKSSNMEHAEEPDSMYD